MNNQTFITQVESAFYLVRYEVTGWTQMRIISFEQIDKVDHRLSSNYGRCLITTPNNELEEVYHFTEVIDENGIPEYPQRFAPGTKYSVENARRYSDYIGYNEHTVNETVLCIINDRSCYEKISRAIKMYSSGDYTPQWLNKKLDEYFKYCFRWYLKEYCDRSTTHSDLWTANEMQQIKHELIEYYSIDGENDLIVPAIAQVLTF